MKKRNPNDTTFRNINALKKRVHILEELVYFLVHNVSTKGAKTLKKIDKELERKKK